MAAATVTTILLIVILAIIIVVQLVTLVTLKNRKQQLLHDINEYERLTKEGKDELEQLQSGWYLQEKLLEYGYHY